MLCLGFKKLALVFLLLLLFWNRRRLQIKTLPSNSRKGPLTLPMWPDMMFFCMISSPKPLVIQVNFHPCSVSRPEFSPCAGDVMTSKRAEARWLENGSAQLIRAARPPSFNSRINEVLETRAPSSPGENTRGLTPGVPSHGGQPLLKHREGASPVKWRKSINAVKNLSRRGDYWPIGAKLWHHAHLFSMIKGSLWYALLVRWSHWDNDGGLKVDDCLQWKGN